jgi:hypothetical protein
VKNFGHLFRSNLANYFSETLVKARPADEVLVIYFFAPQHMKRLKIACHSSEKRLPGYTSYNSSKV